jgi:hypothetical protein
MSRALKFFTAVMFVTGPALAQTPLPAGAPAQVDVSVPKQVSLSPEEMLTQSRDYRNRVNGILLRIQSLQEQARKQKDIIRLNCLADKLVQAKVNLNIADQAITAVQEAVNRKDQAGSTHEFTRVTIVHQKAQVLGAEAEACVGEDLSFVGATKVEVEENPDLPKGNFTDPRPDVPLVERPPQGSPSG